MIFASYSVLTRLVARRDRPETSFFYTGIVPGLLLTCAAPFVWQSVAASDWVWLVLLCLSGALGHFLLIKAYQLAEASTLQPFAYLQLVTASVLGMVIFGEGVTWATALGTSIVILAGLANFWLAARAKG
jgi:drug/metabolite transporter (DMT)-like permease